MTRSAAAELARLLRADDPASRDRAWDAFAAAYSRLLLATVRRFGGGHDAAMDRYAYVLEQLRRDDFKRLREYAAQERSTFTTWLVVVTRRFCLDHHRHRYGRPRGEPDSATQAERLARKRLVDFIGEDLDPSRSPSPTAPDPEMALRTSELHEALGEAVRRLPPRDRLLLAFRFEEGQTAREIARLMGFPTVFHVYRRLNAVQGELRRLLERRGVDGTAP